MESTAIQNNKISADVNHFPSITWHHLHINHGHFDGQIDSEINFEVENLSPYVEIKKENIRDCEFLKSIPTQMGKEFDGLVDEVLEKNGFNVNLIRIQEGTTLESPLKITFHPSDSVNQACETLVLAEKNSCSSIVFEYSCEGEGDGLFGHRIRVLCESQAKVNVSTVNLLGKNMLHYNGIGVLQNEGSDFELTQIDLGAKNVISGSSIVLDGRKAFSTVHGAYISNQEKNVDINYICQHRGTETKSSCYYNGILDGNGKKSWRGTIDFVKGCLDAKGNEQENVLLLDPNVVNKSMPVILCSEEDVEGHHGSSIGKLNEDELLYLETRGIDKKEARAMMIKSRINAISRFVPDENLNEKIRMFLESLVC